MKSDVKRSVESVAAVGLTALLSLLLDRNPSNAATPTPGGPTGVSGLVVLDGAATEALSIPGHTKLQRTR